MVTAYFKQGLHWESWTLPESPGKVPVEAWCNLAVFPAKSPPQENTRSPGKVPVQSHFLPLFTRSPGIIHQIKVAKSKVLKNYQESTKTPEGCYQEFLVKCKDVRGNYQDSLYLD
ncbi:hypothetical protein JOM56_013415 [Amanita muscaria]